MTTPLSTKVAEAVGQRDTLQPTPRQVAFIRSVHQYLDGARQNEILEHLSQSLMDLCDWEKDRLSLLDTKGSYLLTVSGIAAAALAVVPQPSATSPWELITLLLSLLLFAAAVVLSLRAIWAKTYGGFVDSDVFAALDTYRTSVGAVPEFADKDPYRCYLRETSLQRWLVYSDYAEQNRVKYGQIVQAQKATLAAILSLVLVLVVPYVL